MITLHAPYLALAIALPLLAAVVSRQITKERGTGALFSAATIVTLLATLAAGADFAGLGAQVAGDPLLVRLGLDSLGIDVLNNALLPFVAGLFAIVAFAQVGAGAPAGAVRRTLVAESILLALFAAQTPAWIAGLFAATLLPELLRPESSRRRSPFFASLVAAVFLVSLGAFGLGRGGFLGAAALPALLAAVFLRKGIFPLHSWTLDLYEHASLSRAILLTTPQVGALIAVRLFIPNASSDMLSLLAGAALFTAVYSAGLACVQRDAARGLGAIFVSQSALVVLGLASSTTIGATGGLCLWISSGLATAGFGTTYMALTARRGRLTLDANQGGFERTPHLAASFLVLGLASVGFPGTLGFVGQEALYDASLLDFPHLGILVALATALNGITVLRAYFALFCGAPSKPSATEHLSRHELIACVLLLLALIGVGLAPSAFLASRQAAASLLG